MNRLDIMILLGAGASTPFEVPTMRQFTQDYKEAVEGTPEGKFISDIEEALYSSEQNIGGKMPFDLETLLCVLTDLTQERLISSPTSAYLMHNKQGLMEFREEKNVIASKSLSILRQFIFRKCMHPVKIAQENEDFSHFNNFYGALMTILNGQPLRNIQPHMQVVYTTNWDTCFKTWAQYNYGILDCTKINIMGDQALDAESFDKKEANKFTYIPLHGSFDLFRKKIFRAGGTYYTVVKNTDPVKLYDADASEFENIFIIYPLEATGYEESVQSPYFDMLHNFRTSLSSDNTVFIIGSSLRDVTISSILEQVIKEKIDAHVLSTLSDDLVERKKEAHNNQYKLIIFTRDSERLYTNLINQNNTALASAFMPIQVEFPNMKDTQSDRTLYNIMLNIIYEDLRTYSIIGENKQLIDEIREKYQFDLTRVA